MAKKITTIEDLAAMITTHIASKEDIKELRTEMQAGFDRIENLLLAEQKREIEDLKTRMKRLEDALAVSPEKSRPEQRQRAAFMYAPPSAVASKAAASNGRISLLVR